MGLSIVKHIIEAHDEKIYVESEYDVGSEFSFTLEKAKTGKTSRMNNGTAKTESPS